MALEAVDSGARGGDGGAGAETPAPLATASAYADAATVLHQEQPPSSAAVPTGNAIEKAPPAAEVGVENAIDKLTSAAPAATKEQHVDPLVAEAEERGEDAPAQEEVADEPEASAPASSEPVAPVQQVTITTTAPAVDTAEAQAPVEEEKTKEGASSESMSALPAILETLQAQKSTLSKALAVPLCLPCSSQGKRVSADQRCLDARCQIRGILVCSACFDKFHRTIEERRHRQSITSNCPQCRLERVVSYCADCDLSFCTPCFKAIHSIPKAHNHRQFPLEGASGLTLARANSSKNFQSSISEMIAAGTTSVSTAGAQQRKELIATVGKAKATTASSPAATETTSASLSSTSSSANRNQSQAAASDAAREKRKREQELTNIDIILIDSDSESDEGERMYKAARAHLEAATSTSTKNKSSATSTTASPATAAAYANGTQQPAAYGWMPTAHAPRQSVDANVQRSQHQNGNSSSFTHMQSQSQQSRQTGSSSSQPLAIEPFNRSNANSRAHVSSGLQNLGIRQVVSSSAYETSNSSVCDSSDNGVNGMMMYPPVIKPVTSSYMASSGPTPPPTAAAAMPPSRQSVDSWDHLDGDVGGAPGVQAPVGAMQFGNGGFAMDTNDAVEMHSMSHVPTATPTNTTLSTNLITTASDWMANPMEDILYDRYYQINLYTVNLEQNILMLNARIVQISMQNLQAAHQLSLTLTKNQRMHQKAQANRINALIALVVQSHSIMKKVKRLRMDSLCDIPQVQTASHKKCVELSQQISLYATNVATLHQQMALTLDSASAMDPNVFHQTVSAINQSIQLNEQSIRGWKEERENEIVRIVQYTSAVREELKRAFHQQKQSSASMPQPNQQQPQRDWEHRPNGFQR